MLVLSRKLGEIIVIDHPTLGPITVRVVEIERGKVRLGIEAPRTVPVYRSELLQKGKKNENVPRSTGASVSSADVSPARE